MTAYLAGMRSTLFEICLPTKAAAFPSGPDWLHEVKYDGYRLLEERHLFSGFQNPPQHHERVAQLVVRFGMTEA
jgi:hypothetical protein